jgi:curved DNA-binding protein CbpA
LVDHYEVLQLSQNADAETIERIFRLLAKRYHPDNGASGDAERFREVHTAYQVLLDPERRAEFDVQYDKHKSLQWQIFEQGAALGDRDEDQRIFHGVLSLLYVARRRDPESGGLGPVHLERMLGVPREHLEFPLWYLKQRGWTETLYSGELAITVDGIDKISAKELSLPEDRLLAESSMAEGEQPAPDESADQLGISAVNG